MEKNFHFRLALIDWFVKFENEFIERDFLSTLSFYP